MTDSTPVVREAPETGIARFLDENEITIIPEDAGDKEILAFVQYGKPGAGYTMRELGQMVYDISTGQTEASDGENIRLSLQQEGFVTVRRSLARLLGLTRGKFYEDIRWNPIHDACDRVEGRHQ